MKLILGSIMFAFAVILTGGLYYFVRKPADKSSDISKLRSIPEKLQAVGNSAAKYLTELFSTKPPADSEQAA